MFLRLKVTLACNQWSVLIIAKEIWIFFEEKGQTNGVEDYLLASYFVVKLTVGFREFLISHGKFKALLFKLESPVQVFLSIQCSVVRRALIRRETVSIIAGAKVFYFAKWKSNLDRDQHRKAKYLCQTYLQIYLGPKKPNKRVHEG